MKCNILATGSKGNCILVESFLALDMGVSFKKIEECYRELKLVFISHEHSDHLNKTTVKKLAKLRPMLRFAVGEWLEPELIKCGVSEQNIDIIQAGQIYDYGILRISPVVLYHDCKNYGLRIYINNKKAIFLTDTNTVEGIKAKNYNLYLIEANYDDAELQERIRQKEESGEYCYEYRVPERHLSKKQAEDFIEMNKGPESQAIFIHKHTD